MRQYERGDVNYETWYSIWMKQLAKQYTKAEIEAKLGMTQSTLEKASKQHLRAIEGTGSMTGNSQRRAQARNNVSASGDLKIALNGALEIYELFPEHTKENDNDR